MSVDVLLDEEVEVEYGQLYVESEEDADVDPDLAFAGQVNGLCGTAIAGSMFLVTGLRRGSVRLRVERHATEPLLEDTWEEIVEALFTAGSEDVSLKEPDGERYPLALTAGTYRVRYCARDMQRAWEQETTGDGPVIDHYLLQVWPGTDRTDSIIRLTSEVAAFWHREHGTAPAGSPIPHERSEQANDGDGPRAGNRVPNERLGAVRLYLGDIRRLDEDLMFALADADDGMHRAVARWAALRALTAAKMIDWAVLAPAVAALRRGVAVPPPFDDEDEAVDALPDAPQSTVARIGVLNVSDDDGDPVQQVNAASAVAATARADSLEGVLDAVVLSAITHGEDGYRAFLEDLHTTFPTLGVRKSS
jgi:hypothetical protein